MTAAVRSLRQDDVDARLRVRIERLQRLLEADSLRAPEDALSDDATPLAICRKVRHAAYFWPQHSVMR